MAEAQGSFPAIERNGEVEVETKRGGRYRFRYATLDAILAAVRKPLAENGLAVTQLITAGNGSPALRTLLIHGPSGEWIAADTPLPGSTDGPHEFGSDLTYKRRYSVAALLGVAPEEDDDGNAGQGTGPARGSGSAPAGTETVAPRTAVPRSRGARPRWTACAPTWGASGSPRTSSAPTAGSAWMWNPTPSTPPK